MKVCHRKIIFFTPVSKPWGLGTIVSIDCPKQSFPLSHSEKKLWSRGRGSRLHAAWIAPNQQNDCFLIRAGTLGFSDGSSHLTSQSLRIQVPCFLDHVPVLSKLLRILTATRQGERGKQRSWSSPPHGRVTATVYNSQCLQIDRYLNVKLLVCLTAHWTYHLLTCYYPLNRYMWAYHYRAVEGHEGSRTRKLWEL